MKNHRKIKTAIKFPMRTRMKMRTSTNSWRKKTKTTRTSEKWWTTWSRMSNRACKNLLKKNSKKTISTSKRKKSKGKSENFSSDRRATSSNCSKRNLICPSVNLMRSRARRKKKRKARPRSTPIWNPKWANWGPRPPNKLSPCKRKISQIATSGIMKTTNLTCPSLSVSHFWAKVLWPSLSQLLWLPPQTVGTADLQLIARRFAFICFSDLLLIFRRVQPHN